MTEIMTQISQAVLSNFGNLQNSALSLLGILCVIDLVLTIAMNFDHDYPQLMIKKIIVYGIYFFLISEYEYLVKNIIDGFIFAGTGGAGSVELILNPDEVFHKGLLRILPLYEHSKSTLTILTGFGWVPLLISFIVGVIAYGIIALQLFITFVEFSIISSLAIIFLPFGVFPRTAFLAEKAIGAIISFGIKIMILSCILNVVLPLLNNVKVINPDSTILEIVISLCQTLAIAFLTLKAPDIASGLLGGSPSLSAGTVAGSASGAATMAASAVSGVGVVAGGVASGAGKAVSAYKAYSSGGGSGGYSSSYKSNIDKSGMSFDDKKGGKQ